MTTNLSCFDVSVEGEQDGAVYLSRAILFYDNRSRNSFDARGFATMHKVAVVDAVPTILPGCAIGAAEAAQFMAAFGALSSGGGFLPPTALCAEPDMLVWWVPPARRHIAFRVSEAHAKALGGGERGEVVPHPGLIFRVMKGQWSVWAITGAERPTETTRLYRAPYFNVHDGGAICVGNVTTPDGSTVAKIDAWNAAFFGSYFTHPNVAKHLVKFRGGPYALWRSLLNGKHAQFPEKSLVPLPLTVADILKHD
jgi:PRTRC genetic system protein B